MHLVKALRGSKLNISSVLFRLIIFTFLSYREQVATKLLLNFGFGTMNLESIYLKCNEHNHGAIKAYKKAGFKKQGILRRNRYYNKKYSDSIVMDIIKKEFRV